MKHVECPNCGVDLSECDVVDLEICPVCKEEVNFKEEIKKKQG